VAENWVIVEVSVSAPLGLTEAVKPGGQEQLANWMTDTAMSGAVAAMGRAST